MGTYSKLCDKFSELNFGCDKMFPSSQHKFYMILSEQFILLCQTFNITFKESNIIKF